MGVLGGFAFAWDVMALSPKQEQFVSAYIGVANGNATEAARRAGYAHPNKQGPALLVNLGIKIRIDEYRAEIKLLGIRSLENRLSEYNERHQLMLRLRQARAKDETIQKFPGGDTGLLIPTVKQIGGGDTAERVEEAELDTGYLREIRELEKQAAMELGQWTDRKEFSGPGGAPIEIARIEVATPALPTPQDEP